MVAKRTLLASIFVVLCSASISNASEQCLEVWGSVEWFGSPGHAIAWLMPLNTEKERVFPAKFYSVRFKTHLTENGTVDLRAILSVRCGDERKESSEIVAPTIGEKFTVGPVSCADRMYELTIELKDVVIAPQGCW